MLWPPPECEKCNASEHWIRFVDQEIEVEQMVGGTRSTDYVYILINGKLINVSHLPGSKLISRQNWGRNRRREIYRVPKKILVDKWVIRISFTNSGYMSVTLCKVSANAIECYWCSRTEALCRNIARMLMFEYVGGERQFVMFYRRFVPRLVDDIKIIAKKALAEGIYFAGHAQRIEETLNDPYLSLFTSMVMIDWRGRVLSLQEKVSHIAELWIMANIIDSIEGKTLSLQFTDEGSKLIEGGEWWVEFTANRPFAYIRSKTMGKEFTFFYQPSIYPHVISISLPSKKRLHLIPDIVVFEGIIDQYIDWGELHKLIESGRRPILVVEVKTGLETSQWRRPIYIIEQLRAYINYLKPKHIILAALTKVRNNTFKRNLKSMGVTVFENLLDPKELCKFKDYVRNLLSLTE